MKSSPSPIPDVQEVPELATEPVDAQTALRALADLLRDSAYDRDPPLVAAPSSGAVQGGWRSSEGLGVEEKKMIGRVWTDAETLLADQEER